MEKEDSCCCSNTKPKLHIRLGLLFLGLIIAWVLIGQDTSLFLSSIKITDNLWIVFTLGLAASVSTCLAITGGVIIAYTDLTIKNDDSFNKLRFHQFFLHGGRLLGFISLGGVLGLIGQELSYTLGFTAGLNGIVAFFLLCLGLQILGLIPSLKISNKRSQSLQKNIEKQGGKWRITSIFGVLTFFIPCGFTQMIQITALASGSWTAGALIMGVFALGTLPGLFLLGIGTSFAKASHKKYFELIVAVILIIFSVYSLGGTLSLFGVGDILRNVGSAVQEQQSIERETIELSHNGFQLVPKDTTLQSGNNYEIMITPESDGLGCMSTIVLPTINKEVHPVIEGKQIVYIIENAQAGQYTFVCSAMGMGQGKLIVE